MFLGDLVGESGVSMFEKWASKLRAKHKVDLIVVNGENTSKNGRGTTPEIVKTLKDAGANVVTSGNHIWANKKVFSVFSDEPDFLLRPLNYPSGCPGRGYTLINVGNNIIAIVSLQGRVFMHDDLDCPFKSIESLLTFLKPKTNLIFVDFHAEATSEKQAMRHFLDGKVSGLYGTHTHVQTSDEQILSSGTSYITDLGFTGAQNSALGIEQEIILQRFLTQMPAYFKVEKNGPMIMNGILVDVDSETGKSLNIERIKIVD
jgi:metallophosphoesterase (TIGR00282 family)